MELGARRDFQPRSVNAALFFSDSSSGSYARGFVCVLTTCIWRIILGASPGGKVDRQFARGRTADIRELFSSDGV